MRKKSATQRQSPETNSDLNGDGAVDMEDFFVLEENFGKEADAAFAEGDISGDGVIDFDDFLLFAYEFFIARLSVEQLKRGMCCTHPPRVPRLFFNSVAYGV